MYDPIHDCYTSVPNEEQASSSPAKAKEEDRDEGHQPRSPEPVPSNSRHDSDEPPRSRYDHGRDNYPSPERKRKRDGPPRGYHDDGYDRGDDPRSRPPSHYRDQQHGDHMSQDAEHDELERKRLRRYEGEKDRARRRQGQEHEIRAGPFARREVVHDRNDRPPRSFDRRDSHHRRRSPQFKYRAAPPPPPHIALDPKLEDPEPEKIAEPPKSPPRKFKRPGARYSQAERSALQQQQQAKEAQQERVATVEAASRAVDDVVRSHYNAVPERGKQWRRTDSKIKGLRSFNNWVKSTLIHKFSPNEDWVEGQRYEGPGLKVLDVGCGKGGDLLKWKSARQSVELYIGVDSADVSIQQAKERFVKMNEEDRRRNRGRPIDTRFQAEFFPLDAWGETVDTIPLVSSVGVDLNVGPREGWPQGGADRWGGGGFDVVSLMFCMHYAFESMDKIRGMLRNVSGALRRGGRFIGTIPSSDIIYDSVQKSGPEFGNSLYKVSFPQTEAARTLPTDGAWRPPWGWKYSFFLEESVEDVPEYVVPWEAFRSLAYEYNLKMEYKRNFEDIWKDEKNDKDLGPLSERMNVKRRDGSGQMNVGDEEWEACKIYMGFCFRKF